MRIDTRRFNSYLLVLLVAVIAGCETTKSRDKKMTLIELHMEANPDGTERTEKIAVNRNSPVNLVVNSEAFLDTRWLTNAAVVDVHGGFSIQLDFDKRGLWQLESTTGMNPGRRVAVLAIFPESRWLAAPLVQRRISNGRLTFTPDCTREEADRIVDGLAQTIATLKKR